MLYNVYKYIYEKLCHKEVTYYIYTGKRIKRKMTIFMPIFYRAVLHSQYLNVGHFLWHILNEVTC